MTRPLREFSVRQRLGEYRNIEVMRDAWLKSSFPLLMVRRLRRFAVSTSTEEPKHYPQIS